MKVIAEPGGIGDALALTPVVRELRRTSPNDTIEVEGIGQNWIWENNPYKPGGISDSGRVIRLYHASQVDAGSLPRKFAKQAGVELLDDTPEIFLTESEAKEDFGISDWRRTVAVDTFASAPARRWPIGRFRWVVTELRRRGWRVFEVGRHDRGSPPSYPDATVGCDRSFLSQLTLRQTAVLLSKVSVYLGNDSGLFHLAAAVKTPQVAIFGPVPGRFRAYWNTFAMGTRDRCQGCGVTCKRPTTYGSSCLMQVHYENVVEAIELTARRFGRS